VAVACHASTVIAERASERTAALVRLDIKRRDVLTATVTPAVAGTIPDTPAPVRLVDDLPTRLDLPDIPTPAGQRGRDSRASKPVTAIRPAPKPVPATTPAASGGPVDDINDWI
jgi:hypothetical protein